MRTITSTVFLFFILLSQAQVKISFIASDSLSITSDLYFTSRNNPYIVVLHSEGGSRGEAKELAARLVNMNYNCIAVDLRCGNESNFVKNETAKEAKRLGVAHGMKDAGRDIISAINYAYYKNNKPVILMGTSFSASLSMYYAINNKKVAGVVAFSPGEHFSSDFLLQDQLKNFNKPLFVTGIRPELENIKEIVQKIPSNLVTVFSPSSGSNIRGLYCLSDSYKKGNEYWLALAVFFNKLKK